jgi:hypothetical protein
MRREKRATFLWNVSPSPVPYCTVPYRTYYQLLPLCSSISSLSWLNSYHTNSAHHCNIKAYHTIASSNQLVDLVLPYNQIIQRRLPPPQNTKKSSLSLTFSSISCYLFSTAFCLKYHSTRKITSTLQHIILRDEFSSWSKKSSPREGKSFLF